MVSKGGDAPDQYNEYMIVNGVWEKIGDSTVDLTDYATKTYADTAATTAKSEAISAAASDATSKANAV
jgi:hypothetical protein